ncbi:hypothetical protein [Azohydromonas aeria]|uniref:hypothetical protein n=1 Tax=Azohydromonas aeria TaxID=2590212 RepID=UPI0012F9FE58|nr:hypothetical protein [Azohydromonas aeria]
MEALKQSRRAVIAYLIGAAAFLALAIFAGIHWREPLAMRLCIGAALAALVLFGMAEGEASDYFKRKANGGRLPIAHY